MLTLAIGIRIKVCYPSPTDGVDMSAGCRRSYGRGGWGAGAVAKRWRVTLSLILSRREKEFDRLGSMPRRSMRTP